MRARAGSALIAGIIASLPLAAHTALGQTAASIDYQFASRPNDLSDDFKPIDGVDIKYLSVKAIDGNRTDGVLWQPQGKTTGDTTLVVMIHGSGGSYRRPPESTLGGRLAAKGYAALAIDTRQHDNNINT